MYLRSHSPTGWLLFGAIAGALAFPFHLCAQYFGQNKIQYETFDFKVLRTPNFDIYYYPEEREATLDAGRMAERWRSRHSEILGWQLASKQPLILYASAPAFQGTTAIPGFIGEGTGGVTEALRRRIVMPFAGPMRETDHVLGHELVHAFQYDIATRAGPRGGAGLPGIMGLPLWFVEGMAEYLSLGPEDPLTAMWMRDAVRREDIPAIGELDNPKYFPYRYGQAVWAFIGGRYGDVAVGKMLKQANRASGVGAVIKSVVGVSEKELTAEWRHALSDQYEPVLKVTTPPHEVAREVIKAEREGPINIGPVVSPDGKMMVLSSQKDLFAIDLYLADAQTGELKRRITQTAVDPHISSIQFINSAGAWSADGRSFVYPAISDGQPELAIFDVEKGETSRRIKLPQFGEILNPAWSPDGREVAFSATAGGLAHLYAVELQSRKVRSLTGERFAELQPAWSPDGSKIAFATDRFTSDLGTLDFGTYRLATLDVKTGDIQEVPGFKTGKHINPQWAPDGLSLYFVSDRDGISNIYRVSLRDGQLRQLTNLQTGVSGITALSPAMSAAMKAERLMFTAFLAGNYGVFAMDSPQALAGREPSTALVTLAAGVLPPRRRAAGEVSAALDRPETGLVNSSGFKTTPYQPRLSLDYIAPPEVGMGVSSFGTLVGGGTALYFSDMLGYHNLMTAVQSATVTDGSKLLNSISGVAAYQNQRHRWTWGLVGGQVPFLSGGYSQGTTTVDGQTVLVDRAVRFWQINRQVAGTLAYPFNRAQRLEFSAGYQNLSFDATETINAFSPLTGELLGTRRGDIDAPGSLHLGTASAALVYDTSIFGGTSPVMGQRYRFEMQGASGTLNFATAIADYRRYFYLGKPSLAFRLMHYGRYGGGAEDHRLQNLYLGYPSLVRGYDPGSFSASECGGTLTETGACPAFDRLIGSKIAVGNAELRIPILGYLGVIPSRGLPPVEIAPFYDTGIAWNRGQAVARRLVSSYGASLRFNVFGYFVAQLSYVRPNDRPAKSWTWEFSIIPGF